jgi:hypothetical protein
MSREVRRVPPDWQHPKQEKWNYQIGDTEMRYVPLHDGYESVLAEFADSIRTHGLKAAIEYFAGGPLQDDYMPDWPEAERTHYQMYESTSEGTPISPVFPTPELLAQWLVDNNASAFATNTASYESWLRVANGGYAPSAVKNPGEDWTSGVAGIK